MNGTGLGHLSMRFDEDAIYPILVGSNGSNRGCRESLQLVSGFWKSTRLSKLSSPASLSVVSPEMGLDRDPEKKMWRPPSCRIKRGIDWALLISNHSLIDIPLVHTSTERYFMNTRRRLIQLTALVALGWIGMSADSAKAMAEEPEEDQFVPCNYCMNECVADPITWCHDLECPSAGASCEAASPKCKGVSGTLYTYRLRCKN
jgi:hypothetical protein